MTGITARQNEALTFIRSYIADHDGVAPALHEISAGLGLKAKSQAHYLISRLEERGHIRRVPAKARCLQIIDDQTPSLTIVLPQNLDQQARAHARENGEMPESFIIECVRSRLSASRRR